MEVTADKQLARVIDHTLLRPDATREQVLRLCVEAAAHGFAAVCVNPCWVPVARAALSGSTVQVCAVVGFPLGASPTELKLAEARWCLANGAGELDMVMNLGEAKSGNWEAVRTELSAVAKLAHERGAILKVILENCLLTKDEIEAACRAAVAAGADFVKTATGFAGGGATVEDVRLMTATVAGACRVKAAGGVRDAAQARAMLAAGAARIGTSAGVAIVASEAKGAA